MRDQLIQAARKVAEDPSDHNVAKLIQVVWSMPFSEMPDEALNMPIYPFCTGDSIGSKLRELQPGQPRA